MSPETVVLLQECRDSEVHGGKSMKFTFQPESKPLDGYTIKRAIHRGGFGEVYYALSDAGKEVALKLLRQHLDVELRGVTQCLNLKHPNLVTIFDIRTDRDGDHWVVMEYVSGKSLNHVLEQHPHGMPLDDVERWLTGLVEGLSFLHDRGIVHRDLKPANIFVEGGTVKIGDVGLSKFISESHRSAQTQSVGTVYYMAPEVAHGRYGREVDIYSLGIILYELLTGRVPFVGESAGEILMKHLSERPDLSPVPMRLRSVVAQSLEKDPLRRTPSAARLLEDFRKAVRGFDIPRDIPEESFIGQTVPDSSAPRREEPPRPQFGLKEQIARDAQEVARHARNAAEQAQQWARGMRNAKHARPNNGPHAAATHDKQPAAGAAPSHERYASTSPGYWIWIGGLLLVVMTLFSARGGILAMNGTGVVRTGVTVLFLYGIFRLIKYLATPFPQSPPQAGMPGPGGGTQTFAGAAQAPPMRPPVAPAAARTVPPPASPRPHRPIRFTPDTLRAIPWRQRMTELFGSLVMASVCTALITLALAAFPSLLNTGAQFGLFAATTLLASWGILALSKLMEGTSIDTGTRRLFFCALGVLIGLATYHLDNALLFDQASRGSFTADRPGRISDYMVKSIGPFSLVERGYSEMMLPAYLVFFGGLFAARRWWWLADSFRSRRFKLSSLLGTSLLALVLVTVFAFAQIWGVTWAAAIAGVVQLSAAWLPPRDRAALVEGAHHA